MRKRNILVYCLIAALAAQPVSTAWAATVGPNDVLISDSRLASEGRRTGIDRYVTGSETESESTTSGSGGGRSTTRETNGQTESSADAQRGSGLASDGRTPTARAKEIQNQVDAMMKNWMKEGLSANHKSALKGYYKQDARNGPSQTTAGTITKTHDELIPLARELKGYFESLGRDYIISSTESLENYLNACKALGEEPMFGLNWNDPSLDWANMGRNTAGEDVDQQDFAEDQQSTGPSLMDELGILKYQIGQATDSIFAVWKEFVDCVKSKIKHSYRVSYAYKPEHKISAPPVIITDTLFDDLYVDYYQMQQYDTNGDGLLSAEDDGFARIEKELEGGHFFKTTGTVKIKGYLDPNGKWHKGDIPKEARQDEHHNAPSDSAQSGDETEAGAAEQAGRETAFGEGGSDSRTTSSADSTSENGNADGSGTGSGQKAGTSVAEPFTYDDLGGENGAYGTQADIDKLNQRWQQEMKRLQDGEYSNASSIQNITGQSVPQLLSPQADRWGSTADTMQEGLKRGFRKDLFGGNGFADTVSWGDRFTGVLAFLANSASSDTYSFTVVDEVVQNGAKEQVLHTDDYTSDQTRYYLEVDGKISNKAADIYTSTHQIIAANLPKGHTYRLIPAQLVKYTAEFFTTLTHNEYLVDSQTGVRLASDEQSIRKSEGTVQHTGWLKYNRSEAITIPGDLGTPDSETPMTERLQ